MDAMSRREIQAEVGELNALLTRMAASRQAIIDEEKTETTASMGRSLWAVAAGCSTCSSGSDRCVGAGAV